MKRSRTAIILLSLLTSLMSCGDRDAGQRMLRLADAALDSAMYGKADSILDAFDSASYKSSRATAHYRELLRLGRKYVDDGLCEADFSMADSLVRYYRRHGQKASLAKSLLYLGSIYQGSGDYPSALALYMEATKTAEAMNLYPLTDWLYVEQGDLYFNQRMFDECKPFYRLSCEASTEHRDTLRMAYAAFRMGRVHTIDNDIDSIVYYYERAMRLGQKTFREDDITPHARYALCDIYIQTEQFDKALQIMPRDEMNIPNWAYWHLGQNHLDSAVCYFTGMLGKYGIYAETEHLDILARTELARGNAAQANVYFLRLNAARDSAMRLSQVEETKRIHAQFNYNRMREERDVATNGKTVVEIVLVAIVVIFILVVLLVVSFMRTQKERHELEMAQERLIRRNLEENRRTSSRQIEENNRRISELTLELEKAREVNDAHRIMQSELDIEVLTAEISSIKARQKRREYQMEQFKDSKLFMRIQQHAGDEKYNIKEDEWALLQKDIDDVYDDFTNRLLAVAKLTDLELKICWLIKLDVKPSVIARMLYKSRSAISMARERLYYKFTKKKGSARQLDEFIIGF